MQMLPRHSLNIKKHYLYLIALLFSCLVVWQVVGGNGVSDLYGILRYGILFASNYVVWVLLIEYLYGSIKSFQDKSKSRFVRMVEVLLSLALLVLFHLIVTNILYYTYLVMATDLTVDGVWTDFQPFLSNRY
jgi:uncharacterized membrane protein